MTDILSAGILRDKNGVEVELKDKTARQEIERLSEEMAELKEEEVYTTDITDRIVAEGFLDTSGALGTEVSTEAIASEAWRHIVVDCLAADVFTMSGHGGSKSRLWCLTDANNIILSHADEYASGANIVVTATQDGKFIYNANMTSSTFSPSLVLTRSAQNELVEIGKKIDRFAVVSTNLTGQAVIGAVYNTSGAVGTEVSKVPTSYSDTWCSIVEECKAGDVFTVTGKGGSGSRLWCFTDKNNAIVYQSEASVTAEGLEITADRDGKAIFNFVTTVPYSLFVQRSASKETADLRDAVAENARAKKRSPSMPDIHHVIADLPHNVTSAMTLDEIYAAYDALVSEHPGYVTRTLLGNDQSNTYPMYRYDFMPELPTVLDEPPFGTPYTSESYYPVVILEACIHGAEKPGALALLNFMALITAAKDNSVLGWMRDNIHFVVVPVVNPYGYVNNQRQNVNNVDINRNFARYWSKGENTTTNGRYRGASALSEAETQYIKAILDECAGKAIFFYDFHTFGSHESYEKMTCYPISECNTDALQNVAFDTIHKVTRSGWANHNLPTGSGMVGVVQFSQQAGLVTHQGAVVGIPSAAPEVAYRFYDGNSGTMYNTDVNCFNAEYVMYAVANAIKELMY